MGTELWHMGHSDLVWKLKWKTVIIQALSTKQSLRMLVKQTSLRMLEAGREPRGVKGPLTQPVQSADCTLATTSER